MHINLSDQEKIILYIISGAMLLYLGLATLICYDAGKHGFGNINWLFVIQGAFPGIIISTSFFHRALKIKKQLK